MIIVVLSGWGVAAAEDLDQRAIRLVLRSHLDEVLRCNERGRPGDDLCSGTVWLRWDISAAGDVSGVTVAASDLRGRGIESCLVATLKTWRFPAGARSRRVTVPFGFRCAGQ